MTKETYLKKLESLLENVDSKEKEDALAYVLEYFDDASDKEESQIIKELGTPEEFAKNIKEDMTMKTKITPPKFNPQEKNIENDFVEHEPKKSNKRWWILLAIVFAFVFLFSVVIFGLFGYTKEVSQDFVDVDIIEEENESINDNLNKEIMFEKMDGLEIDIHAARVEIVRWNGDNYIQFENMKKNEYEITDKNGMVMIKEFVEDMNANAKIVIGLNDASLSLLRIKNDLGSVEVENLVADTVDVDVNMGEVDLENIKSNAIKIKVNMGSVDADVLGNVDHYSYSLKNEMGSLEYNGQEIGQEKKGNLNALKRIEIENNKGEIEVEFHRGRND